MSEKQEQTCDHISKVVKFGYRLIDGDLDSYVEMYGCTKCDMTSPNMLY